MRTPWAALGSAAFFLAAPAVVAGLVPWLIGRSTSYPMPWPVLAIGVVLALAALALLVTCFVDFVVARGTPAPVAPTERLVVEGPYRHVRNPMYLAVVTIILGQALWFGSLQVLAYGALVWTATASFARWYEEPALRRRFGADYEAYRAQVRAWVPSPSPWPRAHEGGWSPH